MVSGQNEAERRKGEAEILSKDLQQQNDRIAERRHRVRNSNCALLGAVTRSSFSPFRNTRLCGLGSTERRQESPHRVCGRLYPLKIAPCCLSAARGFPALLALSFVLFAN